MRNFACYQCHARKVRCDGERPCFNCRKKSLQCEPTLRSKRTRRDDEAHQVPNWRHPSRGRHSPVAASSQTPFGLAGPSRRSEATPYSSRAPIDPIRDQQMQGSEKSIFQRARNALGSFTLCEALVRHVYFWHVSSRANSCIVIDDIIELFRRVFTALSDEGLESIGSDQLSLCLMVVSKHFIAPGKLI